jgi:hypothetical protein
MRELLRCREKFLEPRPVFSIAETLGRLSSRWLKKDDVYRKKALRRLVQKSKFSGKTAEALLDALFGELTAAKLKKLLRTEFRDPRVLDGFRRDSAAGCRQRARGPNLITHVFSGNVPNPSVISLILGMLVKSANIAKTSSEDSGILDIYLESLKASDRRLASVNFLLNPKAREASYRAMRRSDLVVAYGSDATLRELESKVSPAAAFVGYGHRVSFSLYTKEAMTSEGLRGLAKKTARDIWMLDQRGCLSPLVLFLGRNGAVSPTDFAGRLAVELERLSDRSGPARLGARRIAELKSLRDWWALRRLSAKKVRYWESRPAGQWLILYEEGTAGTFFSEGRQAIVIRTFGKIGEVFKALKPLGRNLQAAALEAPGALRGTIAEALSKLGVNRVCRAGTLQKPPLTWHHDGQWNLARWVRWTDVW